MRRAPLCLGKPPRTFDLEGSSAACNKRLNFGAATPFQERSASHRDARPMTEINSVTTLTQDGDVAVITLNSPPVNALSAKVREGLFEGFKAANASDAKAIVLICEGRTFIAGADISEFGGAMAGPSPFDVPAI